MASEQQFTEKERDFETGLDYFGARFFSSVQGRFSSTDPKPIKPETAASVVANFSCDADHNGGSYFNFTGKNQVMLTVNSSWDGVTTADALDKAANALVNTYMQTGGNLQKAIDAANKVLMSIPGDSRQNSGDSVKRRNMN